MGEGAAILWELAGAQGDDVFDPLHRLRSHVGGELGVAEHRQPFLEAQLEPVAAGDAVAGPVVEILMGDDRLDAFEIGIRGGLRRSQNAGGVENIQPLVFHRAHVEVIDGNDVEQVKVVFQTIDVLVPLHGLLQRLHAEGAFALIPRTDPDVQLHVLAGLGGKTAWVVHQIARHQCKQIGRFRPGIVPFGPAFARTCRIAVGQHHRFVAFDADGESGHHVGAVGVIGDLAEALGLALGAIHAV